MDKLHFLPAAFIVIRKIGEVRIPLKQEFRKSKFNCPLDDIEFKLIPADKPGPV